ncbi:MAG: hypothetical protein J6D10_02840, partial [Clostridia bacterium]|nr:hypothetical protein [Clostridia bacterium]
MKKKFMQVVAMVLAIVMILPATVFADQYNVAVGGKITLSATLQNIDVDSVSWKSSDSSVASIGNTSRAVQSIGSSNTGTYACEITGEANGVAVITAEYYTNTGIKRSSTATVQVGTGEASETPETPKTPETPETPKTPETPET